MLSRSIWRKRSSPQTYRSSGAWRFFQLCAAGSLEHKRCVFQNLAKLDGAACAPLLLPILEGLPKDASQPYWTCPEAGFTHVVVQLDDPDIWRTYLKVAKRSRVGLRMSMLGPLCYAYIGGKTGCFGWHF